MPVQHRGYAVGQLYLPACSGLDLLEVVENFRCQQIAANHRKRGRCGLGRGLLDDAGNAMHAALPGLGFDDSVTRRFFSRHGLHREYGAALAGVDVHHLLHDRRITIDQVVGQDHREGFIADHRSRAQDRVAQTQCLGLADIDATDMLGHDFVDLFQQLELVACQ